MNLEEQSIKVMQELSNADFNLMIIIYLVVIIPITIFFILVILEHAGIIKYKKPCKKE